MEDERFHGLSSSSAKPMAAFSCMDNRPGLERAATSLRDAVAGRIGENVDHLLIGIGACPHVVFTTASCSISRFIAGAMLWENEMDRQNLAVWPAMQIPTLMRTY